ncbi:MAG: HAMP domain-containing histidine kinase [Rhizobiales bacterium]|nr:HAMP domain-containing histidine kinase [Hyphomicrobiales bacterium]
MPVVVALLMVAIGVIASERVLSRLAAQQERHLGDLANAYLDGLVAPLVEPVLHEDPWAIFDILDQAKRVYATVSPIETIVTDTAGTVLASSDPRHAAIGSHPPPDFPAGREPAARMLLEEDQSRAFIDRPLVVEGRRIGTVHAKLNISPLLAERREVLWTLIATNAVLTLFFALLGYFAVRRMVTPMKVLAEHLDGARDGSVDPIPQSSIPPGDTETGRLFRSFNRMARAVGEREALVTRLADEERLASLGRLASGVAHEINNPLGGLFNALDILKTHGEKPHARRGAIDLLDRGLRGIRDVVRSVLAAYRPEREPRDLLAADIEDLALLIAPEVKGRGIDLSWHNALPKEVAVPAFPVRQVVLNLLMNACRAVGNGGKVALVASVEGGLLRIEVDDSGPGMPANVVAFLDEKGAPGPMAGVGLGLWLARRMAAELGGAISAGPSPAGGARVRLSAPLRGAAGEMSDVA